MKRRGTRIRWIFDSAGNAYTAPLCVKASGLVEALRGRRLFWDRGLYVEHSKGRDRWGVEVRCKFPRAVVLAEYEARKATRQALLRAAFDGPRIARKALQRIAGAI